MDHFPVQTPLVTVIDDDADVREALRGLFRSVGLEVQVYESAQAYVPDPVADRAGCLVLDVRLPGKSGLEFQEELTRKGAMVPIVFISGHADVEMSVRAMKGGAIEFLTKPVRDQDLIDAVHIAIERDRARIADERIVRQIRADFASLTAREREVMDLVVAGRRNKEVAAELGISEATVKLHRAHIMQKMRAHSLIGLVRLADLGATGI